MTKILILGANHASTMNSLKIGFDEVGIKCKALSFDKYRSEYNNYDKIECLYPEEDKNSGRIKKALQWRYLYFVGIFLYIKRLMWANVVIYYSHPSYNILRKKRKHFSWELLMIKVFVKKRYVWFTGSDIRDPEVELSINPYFKYAWGNKNYEYKNWESSKNSFRVQRLFSRNKFKAIVWDQYPFLNPLLFGSYLTIPHASVSTITLEKGINVVKNIVHAPTAPCAKGSEFIFAAIEKLKQHRSDFNFTLLHKMTNSAYQKSIEEADILIDQLIWGAYGVATQQALQSGKVVVCYLLENRIKTIYGESCPVINANIDNLFLVLDNLLDMEDFNEIKNKGKKYYREMHSPSSVVKKLLNEINN
ncbi:MAG: hypothetical protein ABIO79_12715 [Ferruginibacter sp.]